MNKLSANMYYLVIIISLILLMTDAKAGARSDANNFCSKYNAEKGVNMCAQQRCPCGSATTKVARFDAAGLKIARCACVNKKQLAAWKAEQLKSQCVNDSDCNDGVWCNGVERCHAGQCQAGIRPCKTGTQCDETTDSCSVPCEDKDKDGVCAVDDCDDNDARRFPGNIEICDSQGIDEDCNVRTVGNLDEDGDGFISPTCKQSKYISLGQKGG